MIASAMPDLQAVRTGARRRPSGFETAEPLAEWEQELRLGDGFGNIISNPQQRPHRRPRSRSRTNHRCILGKADGELHCR